MKTFSLKITLLLILVVATFSTVFAQSNGDDRMQIRLGFTSVNNIHRQLLVTVDEDATAGIDFGYDAELFENHQDDMYWMIEDRKFLIQGTNAIEATSILPLGLHTSTDGVNTIQVEALNNVPEDLDVVIFDNVTGTYHDIKNSATFSIDLPADVYLDRFELRFIDNSVAEEEEDEDDNEDDGEVVVIIEAEAEVSAQAETEVTVEEEVTIENNAVEFRFINNTKSITINNPGEQQITSVEVYAFNGQLKAKFAAGQAQNQVIQTNNLNAGNYIIIVTTPTERLSKKIVVK
ncbi:T9SS type A sorting domain-containing protein [Lacinutrix chionoecetis]